MSQRTDQVGHLLRDEISEIISRELKDPRLSAMASITTVEVAPDLGRATVHVSLLGDEASTEETFKAISAAASFIHRELRTRVSLRKIPQLSFRRDYSIERGMKLSALIDRVGREQSQS